MSRPDPRDLLSQRLTRALLDVPEATAPCYVVDLDAFDANAADLARRAGGLPIRVASKSLRVPALIERALRHPGFAGVLAYHVLEAHWLSEQGICDDVLVAYPMTDPWALSRFAKADLIHRERITLMVDSLAHLDAIEAAVGAAPQVPVRVALDLNAALLFGPTQVGLRRSPLSTPAHIRAFAEAVVARPSVRLVGVMTYDGQVAGLQDDLPSLKGQAYSQIVRVVKELSVRQLRMRRRRIASALAELTPLELWNSGGSGSLERSGGGPVTELAAGSGLLVPGLFDHYRTFDPHPAAFFGVRVTRRFDPETVVVHGGGFIASGPAGPDRAPLPWAPSGLALTGLEGAGEVQTPLVGPGARALKLGDWVWFRHAKSGEIAEHATHAFLIEGERVVQQSPTYRGCGQRW